MRECPAITAALVALASRAGSVVMSHYGTAKAGQKADLSPVTAADHEAEAVILAGLAECLPGLPVLAEEMAAQGHWPEVGHRFALVDPVDGTKEFLAGNGEFTVNIALVEHGRPVFGVVYAPALSRVWFTCDRRNAWAGAMSPGEEAPRDLARLRIRARPAQGLTAVASRSHSGPEVEEILARYDVRERVSSGSSLKFCMVAEGRADLYPRTGRTMEWDTAAGQAVAEAAGARVLEIASGLPLLYGKQERGFDNPGFLVVGDVTPV